MTASIARARHLALAVVLTALAAADALPALAQHQSFAAAPVLSLLPTGNRTLTVGTESAGVLSGPDVHMLPDMRPLIAWRLDATAGDTLTIDLRSQDFDAQVYVVQGGDFWSDDDGAGGCDARVLLVAPRTGRYIVVASSITSEADGNYQLSAARGVQPPGTNACHGGGGALDEWRVPQPRGALAPGDSVTAELDGDAPTAWDGTFLHAYEIRDVAPGELVYIRLHSTAFDSYLTVGDITGNGPSDDDSGGACDALIAWTAPDSGDWFILANTVAAGETGAYTISVSRERPPVRSGPCGGTAGGTGTSYLHVDSVAVSGTLRAGEDTASALDAASPALPDGGRYRIWNLDAAPGTILIVDAVSDAFDTFLTILDAAGNAISSDDDGGGRCHSRITLTVPDTPVRILVTTINGEGGAFRVRVSTTAPPRAPGGCGSADAWA